MLVCSGLNVPFDKRSGPAPAYPNPFSTTLKVEYETEIATTARIVVYDLLGRPQAELMNGTVTAGLHEARLDGSRLPNGLYFIVLTRADGATRVQNVLLSR